MAAPAPDPTVVVLEAGGEEGATSDLVAAARAERERRKAAGPPVVVLDDKNIQHFAKDQKLTFANPEKVGGQTDGGPTGSPREDPETYWRQRGRRLRERWKTAVEEIGELKERAAELRTRFYNTDDPYIRDTDVKPAWDRALDRIESMEREVSSIKDSLVQFQEEGQRAGALPAWLLDGFELEPPSAQVEEKSAAPGEPVVLEEKPH